MKLNCPCGRSHLHCYDYQRPFVKCLSCGRHSQSARTAEEAWKKWGRRKEKAK